MNDLDYQTSFLAGDSGEEENIALVDGILPITEGQDINFRIIGYDGSYIKRRYFTVVGKPTLTIASRPREPKRAITVIQTVYMHENFISEI